MTYTVSSGTLNPSIPYHTFFSDTVLLLWNVIFRAAVLCRQRGYCNHFITMCICVGLCVCVWVSMLARHNENPSSQSSKLAQ